MSQIQPINTGLMLGRIDSIIKKHEVLARKRGQDFNLFSIMSMENNETYTHSAILVALLDPKANHYKDETFLKLFLDEIEYDYTDEKLEHTKIEKEYHIGKIDEEYKKGGFIDILIKFPSGKTIAIENKIYAKDQPRQLYRYSKYNAGSSFVYYLNLFGKKPNKISSYTLKEKQDFKIISYKKNIIAWLEKCLINSEQELIVYSSLKQYQLLIQKLTDTMDKAREEELKKEIIENLDAAKYVSHNYEKIIYSIRENFRKCIVEKLRNNLSEDFIVNEGNTVDSYHSQIFIRPKNNMGDKIEFGLESFSGRGHGGGKLFVGIIDRTHNQANFEFVNNTEDRFFSKWWPVMRLVKTINGNNFHLGSENLLKKLSDKDSQIYKDLADHATKQTIAFINDYHSTLLELQSKAMMKEV